MSDLISRLDDYLLAKGMDAERKRASLHARTLQLSFGTLAYDTRGDAGGPCPEAVVMLHGAGADATSWFRFASHLEGTLPLLIPDLPGHGGSTADPTLAYTVAAQIEYLHEFLLAKSIKRVHLIGNSMGGAIALGMAARYPQLVASLVLISPAGCGAYGDELKQAVAGGGHNPLVTIANNDDFRAMLRFGMAKPPYLPGLLISALTRQRIQRNRVNEQVAQAIDQGLDQTAVLADIVAPTLIVWGAKDRVLPASNAALLSAKLAHSEAVVLDNIGHVGMVEAPKEIAALCAKFSTG